MSKFSVKIDALVYNNGIPTVLGSCDGIPFESAPFRWGGKMLMKVQGENEFTQGQKIAIGAAAKKAVKAEGKTLPEAVLVRPRKAKVAEVDATPAAVEVVAEAIPEAAAAVEALVESVTTDTDSSTGAESVDMSDPFDDLDAAFASVSA
jgi:hypothetical protein